VEKQEELKSRNGYAQKYRETSPGNPWSQSRGGRRKKLRREGFAEKEGFKPGMKE